MGIELPTVRRDIEKPLTILLYWEKLVKKRLWKGWAEESRE